MLNFTTITIDILVGRFLSRFLGLVLNFLNLLIGHERFLNHLDIIFIEEGCQLFESDQII